MYGREVWHCLCIQNTHFACNNCVCYGTVSDSRVFKGLHKHAKMNGCRGPLTVAAAHYFYSHGVYRCDLTFESKHFTPFLWNPVQFTSSLSVTKKTPNTSHKLIIELYSPSKGTVVAGLCGQTQDMLKSYLKGKQPLYLHLFYRI